MSHSPGVVLDQRYEIENLLGEGGMGQVFRARHLRLNKQVAIKALVGQSADQQEAQARLRQFESEAQILAALNHPGLVQVTDFFEQGGTHYLVMEYVEGKTLSYVVGIAPRPISERRVLQWASELLDVLEYLHSQSPPIILKDLKPDNVMLMSNGRLKVIDFGIAKRLTPTGGTMDIAKGVGTEEYAPLEQYGHGSTDQRSDLYSLGATLYFVLTRQPPTPAWQRAAKGEELTDPRQFNPTVSEETATALRKLTALFAHDRPPGVQAARQLFAGKAGTGYQLASHQVQAGRTEVKSPSVGHSRALHLELVGKWDIHPPQSPPITRAAWYPHEPLLALGRRGIRVVRLPDRKVVLECARNLDALALATSPVAPASWIALSANDGQVYLFDAIQGRPGPVLAKSFGLWPDKIRDLRFGAGQRLLFALSDAQQLTSYDLKQGEKHLTYRPTGSWLSLLGSRLRSFDVSSGQRVAAGASDGAIFVWELSTARLLWQIRRAAAISGVAFSPDGYFLAVASEDGQVTLVKAEDGQVLTEIAQPQPVQGLAWSQDGRVLCSGDPGGLVRFWDLANGQESLRLHIPDQGIRELSWSHDKRLAVTGSNNAVKVLDMSW